MRPTTLQYRAQQNQFEDNNLVPSIGGSILQLQANASLNIGDVVILDATGVAKVIKSNVNIIRVIGVVVGGQSMPDQGVFESSGNIASDEAAILAGIPAAIAGQYVYVLYQGIFYVVSDGAITANQPITPSFVTNGRVGPAQNGLQINVGATPVTSTAANGLIISGSDGNIPVMGKSIDVAAGGAGVCFLAFINIH